MTEIQMIDRQGVAPFLEQEIPQQMGEALDADGLLLWGAFENGGMAAVAGMQPDGEITVLYVTPEKEKRGIGLLLLNVMRDYAIAVLQLQRVTIEVTPVTRAPYFYKRGFAIALAETAPAGSVRLESRLYRSTDMPPQEGIRVAGGVVYEKRRVSAKAVLTVTAVILATAFFVISGVTIYHLAAENPYTIQDYEQTMEENGI